MFFTALQFTIRHLLQICPVRLPARHLQVTLINTVSEEHHSERGQHRQDHRDCLPESNSARNGGASKDDGSQKAQFDSVWLAILLSISSKNV